MLLVVVISAEISGNSDGAYFNPNNVENIVLDDLLEGILLVDAKELSAEEAWEVSCKRAILHPLLRCNHTAVRDMKV